MLILRLYDTNLCIHAVHAQRAFPLLGPPLFMFNRVLTAPSALCRSRTKTTNKNKHKMARVYVLAAPARTWSTRERRLLQVQVAERRGDKELRIKMPEGTKRGTSVNVQLPCLQKDLLMGCARGNPLAYSRMRAEGYFQGN